MKRVLLLALVVVVGCKKAPSDTSAPTLPATPTTPTKKIIEFGQPEFAAMLAAFKADPKTTKFARELVTFKITVDSVREVNRETYLVKGKGDGIILIVTFLLPPNLALNQQARQLAPGDNVTYWAEPAEYTPGNPPTLTSFSGSILGVEKPAKPPK
jgi:hypothetical protein